MSMTKKKKILIILIPILLIAIIIFGVIAYIQFPKDPVEVLDSCEQRLESNPSDQSWKDYLDNVYDGKGLFGKLEEKYKEQVNDKLTDYFSKKLQTSLDNIKNSPINAMNDIDIIEVKKDSGSYDSITDILVVMKNTGTRDIKNIKIKVSFLNSYGSVIDTKIVTYKDTLAAGVKKSARDGFFSNNFEKATAEIINAEYADK